eukprot:1813275-Amphidinium_carterae.1
MQTHGAQLLFEKDALNTQLVDLARHAALNGVCHDIQWTGNKEPEGFSVLLSKLQLLQMRESMWFLLSLINR